MTGNTALASAAMHSTHPFSISLKQHLDKHPPSPQPQFPPADNQNTALIFTLSAFIAMLIEVISEQYCFLYNSGAKQDAIHGIKNNNDITIKEIIIVGQVGTTQR